MKFTDLIVIILFICILAWGAEIYFSIPDVYWSYSQDKCIKIVFDGVESDCSQLPEKYRRIYIK